MGSLYAKTNVHCSKHHSHNMREIEEQAKSRKRKPAEILIEEWLFSALENPLCQQCKLVYLVGTELANFQSKRHPHFYETAAGRVFLMQHGWSWIRAVINPNTPPAVLHETYLWRASIKRPKIANVWVNMDRAQFAAALQEAFGQFRTYMDTKIDELHACITHSCPCGGDAKPVVCPTTGAHLPRRILRCIQEAEPLGMSLADTTPRPPPSTPTSELFSPKSDTAMYAKPKPTPASRRPPLLKPTAKRSRDRADLPRHENVKGLLHLAVEGNAPSDVHPHNFRGLVRVAQFAASCRISDK